MWKPRMLRTLLLVLVVAISLLAVALAATQPASPVQALRAEDGARPALSQRGVASGPAALPAQVSDPNWQTWVDGLAWSPGMDITAETSDTIKVVNVVTTLPRESIELVETWTPGELKLLDVQIQPGGSTHSVEIGRVTWQVPEGEAKVYTLTKWFHVEKCTWTRTVLTETLSVASQPAAERLIAVSKLGPDLWIESDHVPIVRPGDVATFTLRYGNAGGYENDVRIRTELPSQAPFAWSDPPPDVISPGRLTARWNVGDLAGGSAGEILVAIAITDTVPPPPTLKVWGRIYDHVDGLQDEISSTFTVEPPLLEVTWKKYVNGQPWNPDLVVTAQSGGTIMVRDVVFSADPFILIETWNPAHLSLAGQQVSAGGVVTGIDRLEWAVPAGAGEVTLVKTFQVKPGFWDWTALEEVLEVSGERHIRLVPIRQRPISFPEGEWPWYAQDEIAVHPEPPVAGRPTELCAEVVNRDPDRGHPALIEFAVANFGIGMPFDPVGRREVWVPPGSRAAGCIVWIPPKDGHWCIEVRLIEEGKSYIISQRNVDVDEPLAPATRHDRTFPVRNPFDHPVTITLGLIPHFPDWGLELSQDVLPNMAPWEIREVTLSVTPPGKLPDDGTPVVDVEAYVTDDAGDTRLIGGFRKIFRPPVILHPFPDPPYAEREITVHPYPPRAGEPTEICVELRNPTPFPQDVTVQFSWAAFGIGLPFTPINGLRPVHLPPHSIVKECIYWIPPVGGHVCLQVELLMNGYAPQRSQRNLDVDEPLRPRMPHALTFPVGNPLDHPVTITLGLIPHFPDWGLELSQDVLPNMSPGEIREVTLTVTPPGDLPADGDPIVDVEAYVDGDAGGPRLIGGFRKIFRPPVPIHQPRDPVYAESEIGVDPYPAIPGQPTQLSVEVFNPTDQDRFVTVTFSIAPFGIGLPFSPAHIAPNPIRIFVPRHGAARGHVVWTPPGWSGKFCVQVTLEMEGYEPIWSRRNVDVGEPLKPGVPHAMAFPVGNPFTKPVTVTLGLIPHMAGWGLELSQDVLPALQPGQSAVVTLTVTPPNDARLGTGAPIVDVEGFVDGELVGGFRKLDRPPVPLHKPHEKSYAESEIIVDPYPPQQGVPSTVSTVVQNAGDVPMTVDLEFGWADFGMGIPFTTTGMVPVTRSVTLGPMLTETASVTWTPVQSGHQCLQVRLLAEGYLPQQSQRNVDVTERPPCGVTKVFTFTVYNMSPFTVTVDVGMITFNVPADWQITVTPSPTLEIGPFDEGVVTVTVQIPCPATLQVLQTHASIEAIQQAAGSVPTIDVEGYVAGELIGGIEIRFAESTAEHHWVYLPLVLRN